MLRCKGFGYGLDQSIIMVYRVDIQGRTLSYNEVPDEIKKLWVPILYRGPFNIDSIRPLREGSETVSGKSLHKKEGIVVTPEVPRSARGIRLYTKLLNPKYAPDVDNDIN